MSKVRYEKLEDILREYPLDTLTYEMIRWQYGTGVDESTYKKGKDGRNHVAQKRYRNGVQTPIGDIREEVWYALAEKLIYKRCEGWLLDSMEEWYSRYKNVQQMPEERFCKTMYQEAVEATASHLYEREEWVGFLPFNLEYYPQMLQGKEFFSVLPACCGNPALVPVKGKSFDDKYCCPHCHKWVDVQILRKGTWEELSSDADFQCA